MLLSYVALLRMPGEDYEAESFCLGILLSLTPFVLYECLMNFKILKSFFLNTGRLHLRSFV